MGMTDNVSLVKTDADGIISRLSEIRGQYNCFDESEEPYYRALSAVIKMLSEQADGDTISRQAALDCVAYDVEYTIECIKALPSAQLSDVQEAYNRGKIDGIKECTARLKKVNEEFMNG